MDPSAQEDLWQLPSRMRQLARRLEAEILQPTRDALETADAKHERELGVVSSELGNALGNQKGALQAMREMARNQIKSLEAAIGQIRDHFAKQHMVAIERSSPPSSDRAAISNQHAGSSTIHVHRGTTSLGGFPQEEVYEGLKTRRFSENDLAWREGMPDWIPLSQFLLSEGAETAVSSARVSVPSTKSPSEYLSNAAALLEQIQTLTRSILTKVKPKNPLRPDQGAAGCALAIAALTVGSIFGAMLQSFGGFIFGAGLVYVGVMIALHYFPASTAGAAAADVFNFEGRVRQLVNRALEVAAAQDAEVTEKLNADAEKKRVVVNLNWKKALKELEQSVAPTLQSLHTDFREFMSAAGFAAAEWSDPIWTRWAPQTDATFGSCFGQMLAETNDLGERFPNLDWKFQIPALIPFLEGKCLLLKGTGNNKDRFAAAVQAALARLLATIPPGKLRFTFFDPIGLGQNVAQFMLLADFEDALVTSRAWTEPQHIEQRLSDLSEHMEIVIQKYLRTDFKTIHEYNEAAKEVAEAYRFLVVFDFPTNFSDTSARRLVSIARNGARCGVYAIIVCDSTKPLPYGFALAELEQSAIVISGSATNSGDEPRWVDADFQRLALQLDQSAPREIIDRIISALGARTKEAMRVEVPYSKLLSLAQLDGDSWWKAKTNDAIRVPLGRTGARKLQYLTLGEDMGHHGLIVGRTGSGKSNLMHVIITTIALTYSPAEIRVYLIDFKKGVEFKCYADYKLPHAEAIAIESEREFAYSVVERLDRELKIRGDLFNTVGVQNITQYRAIEKNDPLPRILLIVDEFQEFFTQDDYIARQTSLILDRLVRQGRGFGIHVLLGSQTLAGTYNLNRSTLDQMAVRIAMQCSEADSRLILSDDNPVARLLSRPGEAIYNAASGLLEGNNLFQVARFTEEDRDERLRLVENIARDSGSPVPVPIVFEGNELAHLADCRKLHEALDSKEWPAKKSVELLLGDPIAIRDPIAARLRRQTGSNLLILSRDEAEGVGMCVASMISILSQRRPGLAQIFIADFTLADSEWAERAEEIEEFFPHEVRVLSRQREWAETVKNVADEVKRRSEAAPEDLSIYLVLQGMQRMKILRTEDESFRYKDDETTPSELFATILREGPEVGVHVIAWCDTYANARRVADSRTITEFGLRAGGVMSADDSQGFFDDLAASRIDRPHRVLFFDEERPGQLDKFRPYSMPPREWLEATGHKLRDRLSEEI
jgi:S-DNA-T family DNA segregation ATPase FtsK/SpoIIIE